MKEEEYWILLSKKLTGEATVEELELLKKLTDSNFEWKISMENLQDLWNSRSPEANIKRHQENEDDYLTHINRLKKRIPDFDEYGLPAVNETKIYSGTAKRPFYTHWVTYVAGVVVVTGIILLFPFLVPRQTKNEAIQAKPFNEKFNYPTDHRFG
jgi:hypothetical protein